MARFAGQAWRLAAGSWLAASSLDASALTLQEAANAAFRSNPTLQASRYGYQAALEGRREAGAAFMPRVSLGVDVGRSGTQEVTDAGGRFTDRDPLSLSVALNQDLYVGGRRGAAVDAAEAAAEGAKYALRAMEQSIMLDVVEVYADTLEAQEQVAIRQRDVEALREVTAATSKRLGAGLVSRTDVHQAEGRLAVAEGNLFQSELELDVARADFQEVVGEEPGELSWPAALEAALPQSLAAALERARAVNPEVQRAMETEQGLRAQERIARSSLRPTLSLAGSVERAYDDYSEDDVTQDAVARLRLRIPLYEGGLARSRVRQNKASQRQAQARTDAVRRSLARNATAAWSQVSISKGLVAAAESQLAATEQALEGVRREQALGLRTTLDVLLANDDVRRAEGSLAAVRRDRLVADYTLLYATGALGPEAFGLSRAE
jgi:outer membrane protein